MIVSRDLRNLISPSINMGGLGLMPSVYSLRSSVSSPNSTSTQAFQAQLPAQPPVSQGQVYTNPGPAYVNLVPDPNFYIGPVGLTPLGWGAVLVAAFVGYRAFFAKK